MRTVIFDLDGTLVDTSGDLIAAANACFRAMGCDQVLDPEEDQTIAFHGGRALLRLGFRRLGIGEDRIGAQYPLLLEHYGRNIDVFSSLYPGLVLALKRLRKSGYRTGICTNKPEGLAEDLIQRLGIRHLFDSLVGADTLPVRKPDPAPYIAAVDRAGGCVEESLLVGDTAIDQDTATAAGVPCILVTFGAEGKEIEALNPDARLDHYEKLVGLVPQLIG